MSLDWPTLGGLIDAGDAAGVEAEKIFRARRQ